MATNDEQCVLCGLDVGDLPYLLKTAHGKLKFCCDGCLGIYQLLNDCDEHADPAHQQPATDPAGEKESR